MVERFQGPRTRSGDGPRWSDLSWMKLWPLRRTYCFDEEIIERGNSSRLRVLTHLPAATGAVDFRDKLARKMAEAA